MTTDVRALRAEAAGTLRSAVSCLLGRQDPAGWWKGELETNVTMDAEDLFLREFLGVRTHEDTRASASWIRSRQREDGTWANFFGGPGDLSTTVEAYVGLRLAGDDPAAVHMSKAREFIRAEGGLERTRVFTRIWMALLGLWSWDDLPALPVEMVLLPSWVPLNVYDFACWARQTIVALTVVAAHRPRRPVDFRIDELRTGRQRPELDPRRGWGRAFQALDRVLRSYERRPVRRIRRRALRRAEQWIVDRQESDGSWGGIQPPWVYSLMALRLVGRPMSDDAIVRGLRGLEAFTIHEGGMRRLEACQSPVWDTCLAVIALTDAGVSPEDPAMERAGLWLLENEIRVPGDWCVRRPGLAPGGWAFEFANVNYPDLDDTAEVVLALRRLRFPDGGQADAAVARGVAWCLGMQSRDGGWASFDADNTRRICERLPFCDFGEVIDPPSADVTAHVVEMLAVEGRAGDETTRRGVGWLLDNQEQDGSWFGRWGANHLYGTGSAIPALVAAGVDRGHPAIRAGVAWLERHQNPDGGWGEDLRSYSDPGWIGRGDSTASQTAWALLAMLAAGERSSAAVERGVAWLVHRQLPDGGWDEPWFTGTGFPGDFYINYHLYRVIFPVMALGRFLDGGVPA